MAPDAPNAVQASGSSARAGSAQRTLTRTNPKVNRGTPRDASSPVPPSPRNPVLARFSRRASREPHSVVVVTRRNPHHTVTPITVTHSDAPRARARRHPPPRPYAIFFSRPHSLSLATIPPRPTDPLEFSPESLSSNVVMSAQASTLASRPVARRPLGALRSKTTARPAPRAALARPRAAAPPPDASDASDTSVDASRVGGVVVAAVAALSVVADVAIAAPAETVAPGELSAEALYGRVSADNAAKAGESVSTSAARGAKGPSLPRSSLTPGRRSPRWRSLASSP